MKATDLLRNQHQDVERAFVRVEDAARDEREQRAACERLLDLVAAHSAIEKEIFYPACLDAVADDTSEESAELRAKVRTALEEHALVDFGAWRVAETSARDGTLEARLEVLKEMIEHHVQEEEGDLLPRSEDLMDDERLAELGAEMEMRFDECLESGHADVLAMALGLAGRAARAARAIKKAVRGAAARVGSKAKAAQTRPKRAQASKTAPRARGRGTSARSGRTQRSGRGSSGGSRANVKTTRSR